MKYIEADKTKDGWIVRTTDTRTIHSESDIYKFIKQEGLKVRHKIMNNNKVAKIFAD